MKEPVICLFSQRLLMRAVDGSDEDGAGIFIDVVMDEVGELRDLGAADVLVAEGGEVRIGFDRF